MDLKKELKDNTSLTPAPSADSSLQDSPDRPAPVTHAALEPPGTNFPGGIKTLSCQQAPGQPASGMHGLTCVSVCIF